MTTKVYENSLRAETLVGLCRDDPTLGDRDIIVLPIPSTRDGVHVGGGDITLSEAIDSASRNTLVIGYGIPDNIKEGLRPLGALVVDSLYDEEFLVENAGLTATATLAIILNSEVRAPRDLSIGIIGYGRVGAALLRELLFSGARVKIYTGSSEKGRELGSLGIAVSDYQALADIEGLDILINTAPMEISVGGRSLSRLRIIDLASGVNFPEGLSVERYPSIPMRMFPVSAGGAWYRSVLRAIS